MGQTFDWLVKLINKSLQVAQSAKKKYFIGVLDIFGFEKMGVR